MKTTIIFISALLVFGIVCNAQNDTIRRQSDSLKLRDGKAIKTDSLLVKAKTDTMNYALLFVYRPRNFTGSFISYDLDITNSLLKDILIGRVKNNSKFVVKLYQEGNTQIFAQTESKRAVNIDVKFGKKYFLKCGISMGIMVGRPDLNLIYPEQGELDYANVEGK